MENVRIAAYIAVSLAIGMIVREYARAATADRLGDPSPKRWGRLTLNPRSWFDPFGSGLLPGLLLVLIASGYGTLPFAYGKPLPIDRGALKNPDRDTTVISLAGPVANLLLAALAAPLIRLGLGGEACVMVFEFVYVNLVLCVFNLMPIPGLDGSRILARFLPPRAREVYTNLDQYLVLFILVIFFLLSAPLLGIVDALTNAVFRLLAGPAACV